MVLVSPGYEIHLVTLNCYNDVMKLLLTSGGIRNNALADALFQLTQAPASEVRLAFIPTAANVRDEDKCWLIDDLANLKAIGFARLDIVDIAALSKEQLGPRLEQADVLVFGGGDTKYLLQCIHDKLASDLTGLLQTRVLVGISAGSVICCPVINPTRTEGLGYVDFLFIPHMGSSFANRTRDDVQGFASMLGKRTYWADDNAGVLVNGNSIKPVGAGSVEIIEP
jgi:dipeptidase E